MTALAYEHWPQTGTRETAHPQLSLWAAASVLAHLLVVAWILASPEPEPMRIVPGSLGSWAADGAAG